MAEISQIYCASKIGVAPQAVIYLESSPFSEHTKSALYSLCGVALKFTAVCSRHHRTGESLRGDRAEQQQEEVGVPISRCPLWTRLGTVSTPASPRLLSDIDSCAFRPLAKRFSIKNDDALGVVLLWMSLSLSPIFLR